MVNKANFALRNVWKDRPNENHSKAPSQQKPNEMFLLLSSSQAVHEIRISAKGWMERKEKMRIIGVGNI